MIILGIDPGYGRLGYAVLEKTPASEKLVSFSCVETSPATPHGKRLLKIADTVEKLMKENKPDALAIEKVFFTTNQKTAMKIAEVRGIISYLAVKNNIPIAEYTPLQVKMAVCGYGKAPKEQVKKMVMLILKMKEKPKYDDTSDAIALCLTHAGHRKY